MQRADLINEIKLIEAIQVKKGKRILLDFIKFTKTDYSVQWFQQLICGYLDKLYNGDIKKLMIFVPPQHGKSEISSRRFPAYILGKNPSTKIAVASYSPDLAGQFNRSIQSIIDSDSYKKIFPNTKLSNIDVSPQLRLNITRNTNMFEVVEYKGFVKTVGIGSALTGTPVDIGIIDDPFKDRKSANSQAQRDDVWDWYNDVFKTRLHNDSKQLLLFTRWHEDDLAGRLLDPKNEHYDEEEASEWTVIALPALKEADDNEWNTVELNDPRDIDEALWEEKHSAKKYIKRKRIVPQSFASLDQQRPTLLGGNMIKSLWFGIINEAEIPFNPLMQTTNFYIDGAFTEKTENDETGLMACTFFQGKLYIYNCIGVRKEMNEFLNFYEHYLKSNYWSVKSMVNIELKASGYPMMSMLQTPRYGNLNAVGIPSKVVALGKHNRVENSQPFLASGKIVLVKGGWNRAFIDQCASFPGKHDDMVDVLTYAIDEWFINGITSYGTDESYEDLGLF